MPFSFDRGLCYRQYFAAVTSLGFVWNAWLSKRLFFFSLSLVFVRGASALRPDSRGGGRIYSRQLVGYSASADVCGEFYSWHLGWNPILPESPVQGIPLGTCLVLLHA